MRAFLAMFLTMGLTACATSAPRTAEVAAHLPATAGADIQCRLERPTGSLIAGRVCTTAEQRAAIKRDAQGMQDAINKMQGTSCARTAGGC